MENIVITINNKEEARIIKKMIQEIFQDACIEIFEDPLMAIKYVCNHEVNRIFVEYKMKRVDAFDIIRILRKTKEDIEIIVFSDSEIYKQQVLLASADVFVLKDGNMKHLQKELEQQYCKSTKSHIQQHYEVQEKRKKKILFMDDDEIYTKKSINEIKSVMSKHKEIYEYISFSDEKSLSKYFEKSEINDEIKYVFINLGEDKEERLKYARLVKEQAPSCNMIMMADTEEYAFASFQAYASGYLLNPITKENITKCLDHIDAGWRGREEKNKLRVEIRTFGNFDVFVDGKPLMFERAKSKELLAYLVDREGTGATTAEISAILWEDEVYDRKQLMHTQQIMSSLMKSLRMNGIENIVIKKRNFTAVNPECFQCDYYDLLKGNIDAENAYMGEYMLNYSWAEWKSGLLQTKCDNKIMH